MQLAFEQRQTLLNIQRRQTQFCLCFEGHETRNKWSCRSLLEISGFHPLDKPWIQAKEVCRPQGKLIAAESFFPANVEHAVAVQLKPLDYCKGEVVHMRWIADLVLGATNRASFVEVLEHPHRKAISDADGVAIQQYGAEDGMRNPGDASRILAGELRLAVVTQRAWFVLFAVGAMKSIENIVSRNMNESCPDLSCCFDEILDADDIHPPGILAVLFTPVDICLCSRVDDCRRMETRDQAFDISLSCDIELRIVKQPVVKDEGTISGGVQDFVLGLRAQQ